MTDKQIIIDGVDVSGCKCYNPNIKMDCLLYPLQSDVCKNNPNCHYKLYKHKEQECEALNKVAKTHLAETFEMQKEIDQLKAENETYKKMLEDEEIILALNEVRTGERHLWYNKAQRLEQTLAEIKEICNSVWGNGLDEEVDKFDLILQKISEVKND